MNLKIKHLVKYFKKFQFFIFLVFFIWSFLIIFAPLFIEYGSVNDLSGSVVIVDNGNSIEKL